MIVNQLLSHSALVLADTSPLEAVSWQSVIVALGILFLITIISVMAIWKYPTADDAIKILATFAGIMGVVAGSFVTYFFTRGPLLEAQVRAAHFESMAESSEQKLADLKGKTKDVFGFLGNRLTADTLQELAKDPSFQGLQADIPNMPNPTGKRDS